MCLPQVLPALDFDGSQVDSDGGLVDSESSLVDSDDFYMGIICQFQCDAGSSRKLCTFERHWVKYPVVVINSLHFQFTAQCALWAVRWPCSILALAAKKHFLMGKQYF